jgi:replicative DNA helicase
MREKFATRSPWPNSWTAKVAARLDLNVTQRDWTCHQSEALRLAEDALMNLAEGTQRPGVPSGIRDLDDSLGGFHDGDLIVVAARPAQGKTAFALNAMLAADCAVGMISGEQGRDQLGMRLLAISGPISLHRMRTAKLHDEEWARLATAAAAAKNKPIWFYDKPAPRIDEVERQARTWKFEHDIGILFVDYLQKLRGGEGENFRLQIGDICTRLKDLARELGIPVIALAQVKREVENRPMGSDGLGRMPYMGDIAEAAIIEQEADQIITLYRPEVYDEDPRYRGIAYANICKNRHGPVGHKALSWRGEYLKFGDLARQEQQFQDRWSRTA